MLLAESLRFADTARFDYAYGYFLPWKDAMVSSLRSQGADVICFDRRSSAGTVLAARTVAAHLRDTGVDLVHCHMPVAGIVGRIAGRLAGIPVVYSEHNLQERFHPVTRTLNLATWRWQQQVIAVSSDVAKSIESRVGLDVPVRVVLNGVDVDRFSPEAVDGSEVRTRLGIPPDAPVVGSVAVFRTQKRLDHWIEAASHIRREIPSARFLLVGDGPLRGEVEEAVERAGLQDAFFLPGLQEEIRPYLAAMDVYLMSSQFEGLPVALLEAMAMELPPVCTTVGGIPEVVRDGENGLLVEPGAPVVLAEAVVSLLRDRARWNAVRTRARASVIEGFSMRRMAGEIESIYDEVLSHPDRRRRHPETSAA
jgi:L-malate glycosyltransferase